MGINNSKLLSGRVPVTPYSNLTSDRYQFLGLGQAEPSLGSGSNGSILTISTDNQRVFSNTVTVLNNTATITNLTVNGNTNLGNVGNLRITGGNIGYVLTTDGVGNLSWQESGNGTPGGSNTQIQFNNAGEFGGSEFFTFDNVAKEVQITGNLVANSLQLGAGIYQWSTSYVYFATTINTNLQVLYSVPVANISGADFHIIATDVTTGIRQSAKISSVVYDDQIQFTEYAGLYVNGEAGVFQINYFAGDLTQPAALQLKVTPSSSNQTSYKLLITLFAD
jgi:hypothetical protein